MLSYRRIPIWQNRRRIADLSDFRTLVVDYFDGVSCEYYPDVVESQKAKDIRPKINLMMETVYRIVVAARILPVICYTPPAVVGGSRQNIDLVHNIFHLHIYELGPADLLDFVERAIGVYENDKAKSIIRTFNPFFWLDLGIEYVAGLPFMALGKLGFNQSRAESSWSGKLLKGVFKLIQWVAALLVVLDKLGYLDRFKSIIGIQ